METLSMVLVGIVAVEHLYILYLEMFAWESKGPKVFKGALHPELFKPTSVLAANQGLYNGFLAAGLIWSLLVEDQHWQDNIALFFLSCVLVAAIYGAFTASRRIFIVQGTPALTALIVLLLK